jgi:DNA (cytosine-5)-methyltransferase 1
MPTPNRPRLLDLFCCEGGASTGYSRAGFDVYGVDLFKSRDDKGYSRKRYPFPAVTGDAVVALNLLLVDGLDFDNGEALVLSDFAALAASPPCQAYSITKHSHSNEHPQLIEPVRELLVASGLPYVMENVVGAPLIDPVVLCGASFNLTATDDDGTRLVLKRHRLFESNVLLLGQPCACQAYKRRGYKVGGAYGGGSVDRQHAQFVRRGGYTPGKHIRAELLGIDWMTQNGMSQSIPPAYTQYIGEQVMQAIQAEEVAA